MPKTLAMSCIRGVFLLPFLLCCAIANATASETSMLELEQIAGLIFKNECASKDECLTSWNEGEEFASLGIGHFIWYPAQTPQTFKESFPALIQYMAARGEKLPDWLASNPAQANPWQNRQSFIAAFDSKKMKELRHFLINSKPTQALFVQQRLKQSLAKLLAAVDLSAKADIQQQFNRLLNSPMGTYVLMDYVNFKGEGISKKERYQGKGWGLLQVLEHMQGREPGLAAIQAFAVAADQMLTRRVSLSPAARNEARWLPGWRKRLQTYPDEAEKLLQHSL